MATIKNADVRPALEAIVALRDERLPIDTSIQLRYLGRELEAQAAIIEAERVRLLTQHNGVNEQGQPDGRLTSASPEWPAFRADYEALMAHEFEVKHPVKLSMLTTRNANGERVPLDPPASVVFGLGDLLVDDAATTTPIAEAPSKRRRRA